MSLGIHKQKLTVDAALLRMQITTRINLVYKMKIVPNELVKEMSGKMCKAKGSPIMAFNHRLDVQYAFHTHIVNPRIADPSEQQVARRQRFAATVAAIKQKKANPTEWEAIKEGFKNQSKYKLLWNYAFSVIYPTIS